MANKESSTKRALLRQFLLERNVQQIDPAVVQEFIDASGGISPSYLRTLLRNAGLPLHPLVAGVRQESFDEFDRSFHALIDLYPSNQQPVRREIIEARDHARMASRRHASPEREEMILWMTVWLENPEVFPAWREARKAIRARSSAPSPVLLRESR